MKGSSGSKGGGGGGGSTTAGAAQSQETLIISDKSVSSVQEVEAMAKKGEIPSKIEGSREDQKKIYEAIDRLYDKPPGIMGDYKVEDMGRSLEISFNYNMLHGEDTSARLPGRDVSQAVKDGAVKYAVYNHRGALELAALSRGNNGYPTLEMGRKYGNRSLSNAEKAQANHEMETHIRNLFKSPLSVEGRRLNESYWHKDADGWRRSL